jgi:hypothetical protein
MIANVGKKNRKSFYLHLAPVEEFLNVIPSLGVIFGCGVYLSS